MVLPGSEVLLDGSSSRDDDGQIVSYTWIQTKGSTVPLIDADAVSARFVAPETQTREELEFQLVVEDNAGDQDFDEVPITVNLQPVADAGPDQTVALSYPNSKTVTLTATVSDEDGSIASHQWVQIEGPAVSITDADEQEATFTVPAETRTYSFRYTATDDDGAEQTDTVSVYATQTIYSETFTSDANWSDYDETGTGANWYVSNGEFYQTQFLADRSSSFRGSTSYHIGSYAMLTASAMNGVSDYRFSVEITPLANNGGDLTQGNDVGILFKRQDNDNYYRVSLNAKYGFTRFEKVSDGTFQTLAVNAIGYVDNQPLSLAVEVNGETIVVWIDGDPIFAVIDDSMPSSGTVALYSQDHVKFAKVLITEPPLRPLVVLSSPLAYAIALTPEDGDTLTARAVVLNKPVGGNVGFLLDDGNEVLATTDGNGYYTAQFTGVAVGEHEVSATLLDADGRTVDQDINGTVGTGGGYYVTVGDSITNGLRDYNPANNDSSDGRTVSIQGYQASLADLLTTKTNRPQIVFNEGVEGEKASDLNNRILSILERHPGSNSVMMMVGTNDSGSGVSADAFENSLRAIVDTVVVSNGKQIWIAKPPRAYAKDTWSYDTSRNETIYDYNRRIDEIVEALSGDDIHPSPNFFGLFYNNQSLYYDYLHPNDSGYEFMAEKWSEFLP